jgi:hypothetical protein
MKQLLFLFLLVPVVAISQTAPAKGDLLQIRTTGTDTLIATDTMSFAFQSGGVDYDFTGLYEYSILVTADSISGANAGTVYLQVSNSKNDDTTPIWTTIDSDTIDGTVRQYFLYEGLLRARRLRIYIIGPSGTRVTIINVEGVAKKVK